MATAVAELVRLSLITFLLTSHSLCLTANPATTSTVTKPKRFVTKLIHHDSALSPYYNPNASIRDIVSRLVKSSAARFTYLKAKSTNAFVMDDTRAGVVPEKSATEFMANFSFGEPPVPQLLAMDTGSNLLWVHCLPCTKCFKQSNPIFDPSKSSTYKTLPCASPDCIQSSPGDKCDSSNNCIFLQKYLDGTAAAGLMATEKLTFETSDEGLSPVSDAVFGCAHESIADYDGQISGVLGLGPSEISLTTKLGSKFSYCIGSIRDPNYPHNQLIFGEGTKIEGAATPLELYNELYYLTLEGISLGQSRLQIDPKVFTRSPSGTGGTVIDSGTTLSFVVKSAYDVLSAEVQKLANGILERVQDPDTPTALCYKGTIDRDLVGFPGATFHLAGGVDLFLDKTSLFQVTGENEFCLAVQMLEGMGEGLNVIGILAQQNYNVAYDIAAEKVYFQYIDCELLEN
ncbi:putative nepenthesin [Rosa chinensis]|uniref:Putative nepenthesin n=1 Tax=Rosa chinensis TaxID=74649 RepID=A0A2P6QSN9_ROSCH|nr:aspartic proteinase CDR1 [Rosa chinensis]PRQ37202.1 putative nepenthesin [Rosa chinensis]